MEINWTKLPFPARNRAEFSRGLTDWLGHVFYDLLPAQGYEVREEQIYTAYRMARALADGQTLFTEAGPGTGKTFAYLLPAVCYARFTGKPVLVASASGVLQAQLASPHGDIQTLSRLLDLQIDARLASDPAEYLCEVKVKRFYPGPKVKGAKALNAWAGRTGTGARREVPDVPDDLWAQVAWDPSLPCDTCKHRGTCHLMQARRHYRASGDLVVADHLLFSLDLLTRQERQETGKLPVLPPYSAVVLDEGQHVPETWQRVQGFHISSAQLNHTLDLIVAGYGGERSTGRLSEARWQKREYLSRVLVGGARQASGLFLETVLAAAVPGEGKRHLPRNEAIIQTADDLSRAIEALQDELVTEEAMQEGTAAELTLRTYQARLDEVLEALALFGSPDVVPWVEGEELWVVPRKPLTIFGTGRLSASTPVIISSATLEPAYMAGTMGIERYAASQVGVPFNLAQQVLVFESAAPADEVRQVASVIKAMQGRTLVLVHSLAEVQRYKQALKLPWKILFEGDTDRGAMLERFRQDVSSVLMGATFWEGVDVPGESLSCVVIPRLPFPARDPLIAERRAQAVARGEDPFTAVDLPEMLLKLKQGAGRLIRTTQDRGVLALLDRSYVAEPWAESVEAIFPEGAERTGELARVASFCPR